VIYNQSIKIKGDLVSDGTRSPFLHSKSASYNQ